MKLSSYSRRLVNKFEECAMYWGWMRERGAGAEVDRSEKDFNEAKQRLENRIDKLEWNQESTIPKRTMKKYIIEKKPRNTMWSIENCEAYLNSNPHPDYSLKSVRGCERGEWLFVWTRRGNR